MSDVLSEEQVAELVTAASREGPDAAHRARRAPRVRTIDFSRPTKFSQDQQRKVMRAHETFCRTASTRLSAELRTPIELDVISIDQMAWSNALEEIPQPSVLGIVEVQPLGARLLLTTELGVLLGMVDRLLGGQGHVGQLERPLTEIEQTLARRVLGNLLEQLSLTWDELLGLTLHLQELESKVSNVQLAPPSEPTLTLTIELRSDQSSSTLSMIVPYRTIEPVIDRLDKRPFVEGALMRGAAQAVRKAVSRVDVELRAEVGSVELTVAELLRLEPGSVLRLHVPVSSGVTLCADDTPIHRARPGRDGGSRAVEIIERLEVER